MSTAIAIPMSHASAQQILRHVDARDALAIPGGVRVMAKLARLTESAKTVLDVEPEELELVCEFAFTSGCAPATVLRLDALLQEHRT